VCDGRISVSLCRGKKVMLVTFLSGGRTGRLGGIELGDEDHIHISSTKI
jgi:hypothetical protein